MDWFSQYRMAAPIPQASNYPDLENEDNFDDLRYNIDTIRSIGDEIENDFPYKELSYIGSGTMGVSYEIPSNDGFSVLKVTKDMQEYSNGLKLMKLQKGSGRLPGVVEIFSCKKYRRLFLIKMEKVKELIEEEKLLLDIICENFPKAVDLSDFQLFYNRSILKIKEYKLNEDYEFLKEVYDFILNLHKINIKFVDLHGDNVGRRFSNNELVLLDIG